MPPSTTMVKATSTKIIADAWADVEGRQQQAGRRPQAGHADAVGQARTCAPAGCPPAGRPPAPCATARMARPVSVSAMNAQSTAGQGKGKPERDEFGGGHRHQRPTSTMSNEYGVSIVRVSPGEHHQGQVVQHDRDPRAWPAAPSCLVPARDAADHPGDTAASRTANIAAGHHRHGDVGVEPEPCPPAARRRTCRPSAASHGRSSRCAARRRSA